MTLSRPERAGAFVFENEAAFFGVRIKYTRPPSDVSARKEGVGRPFTSKDPYFGKVGVVGGAHT